MRSRSKTQKTKDAGSATSVIPRAEWGGFLATFGRLHRGWLTRLETNDRVTEETVTSQEMPLQSIELDLEDEKNPRINVSVKLDNKELKHILFLPSRLVLRSRQGGRVESLEVETVNTETTVYFRPQEDSLPVM
jgi:hypothetical protein